MDNDNIVLPADDKSFDHFKQLCKEEENWQEVFNKKGVRVCTRSQDDSNIKLMRARTTFSDIKASTVFDIVNDTDYRKEWDKDMMEMTDICKLCVNNSVSYYAVKCPTPVKNRDCVFLCSWIAYPNMRNPTEYIMINKSVSHKDYPPRSSIVRAISIVTGYLIKPLGENKTEFTYLTHFDPRGSVPKWVVNTITQLFTPKIGKEKIAAEMRLNFVPFLGNNNCVLCKVIHRIHKAAKRYPVWKAKHNERHKPWLWPEQNRLPPADMTKLSARVDMVEVIDETNLKCDNEAVINNSNCESDSDSDEIPKQKSGKKAPTKATPTKLANGNGR